MRGRFPLDSSLRNFSRNFDGERMHKAKTHKGMAKRFKVTGSGKKAKHRSANRGHILGKKSGKRKRHLRNGGMVDGANARMIVEALRPGS
jgi:large subunit ribosomal protein L35